MKNKNQNPAVTIMKRELGAYFSSPAAYIVAAVFLVASGIFFFSTFFLNGRADLRNFFALLPITLSLFVPALTMRLFSEELKSGSFETLMTLPVTSGQVVAGKFLAAFLTSAAMLLPTLFYVVTACIFGKVDAGPIIGGYVGAIFLCGVYSAVGVFSSSLTKNQIIAFFTAAAISFTLTLLGTLLIFLPAPLVRFFSWLSVTTHFNSICRGIADSRDALYFITVALVFLLFTERKFSIKKIRSEKIDCIIFLLILFFANLISLRSFLRCDLTGGKIYSISKASREVVRNLQEPLCVNVFFSSDLPAPYNSVQQYLSDILVEYKSAANENFSYKIFDMSKKENEDAARSYGIGQTQVQKVETTEVTAKAVWMGAAISYGDDIKVFDSLNTTAGLEYKITTAITKMISAADTLSSLQEGLQVTLYDGAALKKFGIAGLENLQDAASDAVSNLNKKFAGRIKFSVKNAEQNEAEAAAQKYGLQFLKYDDGGTEKSAALGIVAQLGEKFVLVPVQLKNFFGWRLLGMDSIEENLSSAIESLLSKTVEIGYITGHGENSLYQNPYSQTAETSSENFRNALNDIYTLKELNLAEAEIPLNIKCVVVNGPKTQFSDAELFRLDQFVMRGGNVLFCLDPLVEVGGGGYGAAPTYEDPQTGLKKLLSAYGIAAGADFVMDQNCAFASQGRGEQVRLEWAPLLGPAELNSKNAITKFIPQMIFLQNGSIDIKAAEENAAVTATVLATSSEKSWVQSENIILYPGYVFPPQNAELQRQNLAVLLEGKFSSAFAKEDAPLLEKNSEEDNSNSEEISQEQKGVDAPLSAQQKINAGIQNAKIIFVSSAQVTSSQLIDADASEPMAYFMRNAVDYLNGSVDYCEMRTKGVSRNLLEVKNAASAAAFKAFNQFGLAFLVVLAGLFVWKARAIKKRQIRLRYNPNDERDGKIEKNKNAKIKSGEDA